jgi:hypothetical protein
MGSEIAAEIQEEVFDELDGRWSASRASSRPDAAARNLELLKTLQGQIAEAIRKVCMITKVMMPKLSEAWRRAVIMVEEGRRATPLGAATSSPRSRP